MNASEWRYLSTGDAVEVHDPPFPPATAVAGTVAEVTRRGRGVNEVSVRLDDGRLVWPASTTVHRPQDPGDRSCWRCADLAAPPRGADAGR